MKNISKKKILYLHSSSDLYGASKIFLDVIKILMESGYEAIVCLSESGPLVDELKKLSISVNIIELGILRRKYNSLLGIINRIFYLFIAVIRLSIITRRNNIDIIYSNTLAVTCGVITAKIVGKKHIWHIHEIILKPKILTDTLKYLLKLSSKNIVVSNEVKKCWAVSKASNNYDLLYNGLNTEKFDKALPLDKTKMGIHQEAVIVGMIARVHYWKGQEYFLEIANLIKVENKSVYFVMVGDAYPGYEYLYDKINSRIRNYNLNDKVINLGYREDIPQILKTFDIFILPSILPDPLPTTILEAMAASVPVIATSHGGALEMVVDGETGFCIPHDNAQKAAAKILELVKDKELRIVMGRNGYYRIKEKFSVSNFRDNLLRILDNL